MGEQMETLRSSIIKFAINNRKVLGPAEQWLNDNDWNGLGEAWEMAINQSPRDWRKIVFIAWLAFDEDLDKRDVNISGFDLQEWKEQQLMFLACVIFNGIYTSGEHPNYWVIKNALDEGSKPHDPKDLIDLKKATELFACSRTHIKRLIDAGQLKSYKKTPNGKHYISIQQSKHRLAVQPKYTT